MKHYENHQSIIEAKKLATTNESFIFLKAKIEDINKITNSLDLKKGTGTDGIPNKNSAFSFNSCFKSRHDQNSFSEFAKVASVRLLYKKGERCKINIYRPVSVLDVISNIYETYLHNCLTPFVNIVLSDSVTACRKRFGFNHVLIRLIEEWKESVGNKNIVEAVLIDLAKPFECISHDLLKTRVGPYGLMDQWIA